MAQSNNYLAHEEAIVFVETSRQGLMSSGGITQMPFTHLIRGGYMCWRGRGESMCERRGRSVSEQWWNNPNAIYPPNQRRVCQWMDFSRCNQRGVHVSISGISIRAIVECNEHYLTAIYSLPPTPYHLPCTFCIPMPSTPLPGLSLLRAIQIHNSSPTYRYERRTVQSSRNFDR